MDATPAEAIAITANLDGNGQMPAAGHHVAHRSTAPELRRDLRNYRGVGNSTHAAHHDHGVALPQAPTLAAIWNG